MAQPNQDLFQDTPAEQVQAIGGTGMVTGGGQTLPPEQTSVEKPMKVQGLPNAQASFSPGAENVGGPYPTGDQIGDRANGTKVNTTLPAVNVNFSGGGGMVTGAGGVKQAVAAPDVKPETATTTTYNANQATGAPGVTAGTAVAGQATGTQANINEETDLVENRANNIINSNSKLMQAAIRRANQRSSSRGMINGSAGIAAAEGELYNAAIPIATADAAAYNQQRMENQRATNNASIANAQLFTDVSKFNVQSALQAGIVNLEQANAIEQFNASQKNDASRFNAASANEMSRFNIDNLLKAGIINQQQANAMAQFNAGEMNATARQDSANATSMSNAQTSAQAQLAAAQISSNTQMTVAQLNAETSHLNNEASINQSKYNSDQSYKAQIDGQRYSLINNMIQNPDMDPAYRKQIISSFGPGWTEIADSMVMVAPDLNPNDTTGGNTGGTGGGGSDGAGFMRPKIKNFNVQDSINV